jgi:hypothetical protein
MHDTASLHGAPSASSPGGGKIRGANALRRKTHLSTKDPIEAASAFQWQRIPQQPLDPLRLPKIGQSVPRRVIGPESEHDVEIWFERCMAAGLLDPDAEIDENQDIDIAELIEKGYANHLPDHHGYCRIEFYQGELTVDVYIATVWLKANRDFIELERQHPLVALALQQWLMDLEVGWCLTPLVAVQTVKREFMVRPADIANMQQSLKKQSKAHDLESTLDVLERDRWTERRLRCTFSDLYFDSPKIDHRQVLSEHAAHHPFTAKVLTLLTQLDEIQLECGVLDSCLAEWPLCVLTPDDAARVALLTFVEAELQEETNDMGERGAFAATGEIEDFDQHLAQLERLRGWVALAKALFYTLGEECDAR